MSYGYGAQVLMLTQSFHFWKYNFGGMAKHAQYSRNFQIIIIVPMFQSTMCESSLFQHPYKHGLLRGLLTRIILLVMKWQFIMASF